MTWYRSPETTEWIFIAIFSGALLMYALRLLRTSRFVPVHYPRVLAKLLLRLFAFVLIIMAWMGLSAGVAKREVKAIGKDIFFCIDLSRSMDAIDVPPTRLERVKNELKRIIRSLQSNRMGIIIFSSEAFMQCPLTFDQSALLMLTDALNTNLVPSGGTDLAPALRMAIEKLEAEKQTISRATSKIIVLISDGEDFGEETQSITRELKDKGYNLFALGVGTVQGGPINTPAGYKTDREGNQVITKLNAEILKSLVERTGGSYFELSNTRNDINRLVAAINAIEGEWIDTRLIDVSANQYAYLLGLALLLLVADLLVPLNILKLL